MFLDADRDGQGVLSAIAARRDLPQPSYVLHSSPNRLHVLWRVSGFAKDGVEGLQKQLARELKTDKVATSCAQITRLPGFFNHKYRPAPMVVAQYGAALRVFAPSNFQAPPSTGHQIAPVQSNLHRGGADCSVLERARRYLAAIPPAVTGQHGDVDTFRVCCRLVRGFVLDDEDALAVLNDWNLRCEPPWPEADLRSKLRSARSYGREAIGGLLDLGRISGRRLTP